MPFPTAASHDPQIEAWMRDHPAELRAIARHWFSVMQLIAAAYSDVKARLAGVGPGATAH